MAQIDIIVWKQITIPFKAFIIKADIVFFPDYYPTFWRMKSHKVVMFHDTFFWDTPEHYGRIWLPYFKWITLQGVKRGASVMTITNSAKLKIQGILPFEVKVSVISHPHREMKKIVSETDEILRSLSLVNKEYFLHVGVFEKRKSLQVLVKAFDSFLKETKDRNFKLVLVGNPAANKRFNDFPEVVNLIKKLGIKKSVILPGYLSDSDIAKLYKCAQAYIFPSNNEGFGIPILEAFEMGCPVITSSQEALVEVLGGAGLSFEMGNHNELSELMLKLHYNSELRQTLIERGSVRLLDFNRNEYLNKMEAYFYSLP
ncbi:glycosyltransferase family 1 protein [uncultured Roseivirga sp.]|uniref:glycosyltransferase family 4 protein n=1 Tax=uncultured Roseivirga sp. TaxID=543088 RepID=UPI0030DA576C|tara:strand:- start:68846 stop:69787 length:942 start_codon:yes stop_codon:yes gene_type:complete